MPTMEIPLRIDLRDSAVQTVRAKQNDVGSWVLQVQLLDGGAPFVLTDVALAALFVKKHDGAVTLTQGVIGDPTLGAVRIPLTAQTLAAAGIARCELLLYGKEGSLLSSIPFQLAVTGSPRDEETIVSSNEYGALTGTMLTAGNLIERMEELLGDIGSGDLTEVGLRIAAHDADKSAHGDLRHALEQAVQSGYTKDEIDEMHRALEGALPADACTRREVEDLLSAHSRAKEVHGDIRHAVEMLEDSVYSKEAVDKLLADIAASVGEIPAHDCATKSETVALLSEHDTHKTAHRDIRELLAALADESCSKQEISDLLEEHDSDLSAHEDLRRELANRYTTEQADGRLTAHSGDPEAHGDIRRLVDDALQERYTKAETAGLIDLHDGDGAAHTDLRQRLDLFADVFATKEDAEERIAAHSTDSTVHGDIRQSVLTLTENACTREQMEAAVTAHDKSADAHHDLRQALAGKAAKPTSVTGVLTAAGWSPADDGYAQSLPVSGMAAGALWLYDIAQAASAAQVTAFAEAVIWAAGEGEAVCHFCAAGQRPELDLPVVIALVG